MEMCIRDRRKEDVILLIDAQGKLTPELEQQIREATQLQRVEDLYKPYRKKRMTRAQKAREAGLEPLANMIIMQASAKGSEMCIRDSTSNEAFRKVASSLNIGRRDSELNVSEQGLSRSRLPRRAKRIGLRGHTRDPNGKMPARDQRSVGRYFPRCV